MSAHHPSVVAAVKLLASLSAIYMNMSPMSDMKKVRAKIPMDMLPILCMFCNGSFWSLYGVLVDNYFPLVATNAIGILLSSYYLVVIYTHAGNQRSQVAKKVFVAMAIVMFAIMYVIHAKRMGNPHVATHIGYAGIGVSTLMIASPLSSVGAVFKHKSSASMPFNLISAGAACSFLWCSFGVLIQDKLVMVPNAVNLAIGLFQLALFFVFPATPHKTDTEVEMVEKKEST